MDTFGRIFRATREDFINDDLNLFNDVAPSLGRAARRSINDLVWSVIMANGGSFFHADNNNLETGGGSALSLTSLETAVAAFRSRRDGNGNDLDIMPSVLAVPPELEVTARSLLNSVEINRTGDGSPTGNALQNIATLEVESRLSNTSKFTGASATAWYLFGKPMDAAVIVAFLSGKTTPSVEFFGMNAEVDTLGVAWRVYHDYGCALADPKAAQKADGA